MYCFYIRLPVLHTAKNMDSETMNEIGIRILPALESDFPEIVTLAARFDLDSEDIAWNQFIVAKNGSSLIGFGRLRNYTGPQAFIEVATVGVLPEERNKGVGTAIVNELIRKGPSRIYVTCVIPDFFSKFGFKTVKQYPSALQKKVDFCKLYNYTDEQIFVMLLTK